MQPRGLLQKRCCVWTTGLPNCHARVNTSASGAAEVETLHMTRRSPRRSSIGKQSAENRPDRPRAFWYVILISLVLAFVSLVLSVGAVKAAHDLTTGRAIGAVLTPAIVSVIFVCLGFLALTAIGASLLDVLEQIPLGT